MNRYTKAFLDGFIEGVKIEGVKIGAIFAFGVVLLLWLCHLGVIRWPLS